MKVLCKKDYKASEIHTFKKGKYYNVVSEYSYQDSYWIQNNTAFQRFGFEKTLYERYPNFYEHFYTNKEIRKLKIMKLENV
jgi:hypothetical protein